MTTDLDHHQNGARSPQRGGEQARHKGGEAPDPDADTVPAPPLACRHVDPAIPSEQALGPHLRRSLASSGSR
jgi:hypothetical protein